MPPCLRLWAGVLVLALAVPASAGGQSEANIPALVDRYAVKYGIPLYIGRNLAREASGGRQDAVSPSGARGVMQLMPETAKALGIDVNDPEQNIEGGMRYLRQQYDRFRRWDLALAAYHAGPVTVVRHNAVPPKSQAFVQRVLDTGSPSGRASPPASAGRQLSDGFAWPLQGVLTARFGRSHRGIDLAAPHGTPIRASRAGKVAFAGWYYEYGRTVILDHGNGIVTLYGHTSANLVRQGRAVGAGELIARVGCSGRCTGPHVHFEIRVNGRAVDPLREIRAAAPSAGTAGGSVNPIQTTPIDGASTQPPVGPSGNPIPDVRETIEDGQIVRRFEKVTVSR